MTAKSLSNRPLTISKGEFTYVAANGSSSTGFFTRLLRYFGIGKDSVTRRLQYRMALTSTDDKKFYFDGFKVIRDDIGPDSLSDATTLYVTIHEGETEAGRILGKGMLWIPPASLLRQLSTLQVTNAGGIAQRWDAMLRFGRFFAGRIVDAYGANLV